MPPVNQAMTPPTQTAAEPTKDFNPDLIAYAASMAAVQVDEDSRTVELAASSEIRVQTWFLNEVTQRYEPCWQVLEHSAQAIDFSRLENGTGPLLHQHMHWEQIGVIERAWLGDDKKLRMKVKFSRAEAVKDIWQDVKDGIRRNVSIGGAVIKRELTSELIDGLPVVRVTRWQPYEVSLVSVPADPSVGINRQAALPVTDATTRQRTAPVPNETTEQTKEAIEQKQPQAAGVSLEQLRREARTEAEQSVAAEYNTRQREEIKRELVEFQTISRMYGRQFEDMDKKLDSAIERGITPAQFKSELGEEMLKRGATPIDAHPQTEARQVIAGIDPAKYSFLRAAKAICSKDYRGAEYEMDISRTLERTTGKEASPGGILVPHAALVIGDIQRDVQKVGGTGGGGNLVATNLLAGDFITLLRNRISVLSLGARMLTGLVGDIDIPRQAGGATAYWVGEGGSPTESEPTFDKVNLTPKTVGAFVDITRKMLKQSTPEVEQLVRDDLNRVIALEVDRAALNGSGTSNTPRGILNTTGIGSVVGGANGAVPTYNHIVSLETEVAVDNADVGTLAYLTNARIRGRLKQTSRFSNTDTPLWEMDNTVNGYRALMSNQVPGNLTKGTSTGVCSAILFGNFADLLVGMWGVLDVLPDPYTLGTSGGLRLIVMQDVDVAVRHPESFAAMVDALAS